MAFTAGVAILTALLFGTVPALRSTRVQPSEAIKEQGRSIVGESRLGFGSVLVIGQVALSLVLIVAAALFMKTFASLASVRLGFDPDPILVVDTSAKRSAVPQDDRPILFERVRQAIVAIPNVKSAAVATITPMSNSEWNTLIENPPGLSLPEKDREVWMNAISPDWFATYGTPILAGRDFTLRDDASAPRVVIVNETFPQRYFGGAHPEGRFVHNAPTPGQAGPR